MIDIDIPQFILHKESQGLSETQVTLFFEGEDITQHIADITCGPEYAPRHCFRLALDFPGAHNQTFCLTDIDQNDLQGKIFEIAYASRSVAKLSVMDAHRAQPTQLTMVCEQVW